MRVEKLRGLTWNCEKETVLPDKVGVQYSKLLHPTEIYIQNASIEVSKFKGKREVKLSFDPINCSFTYGVLQCPSDFKPELKDDFTPAPVEILRGIREIRIDKKKDDQDVVTFIRSKKDGGNYSAHMKGGNFSFEHKTIEIDDDIEVFKPKYNRLVACYITPHGFVNCSDLSTVERWAAGQNAKTWAYY